MYNYLVFDIETSSRPYEEFDDKAKEIFQQWAELNSNTEKDVAIELEKVKENFALSPFLGEVVAISVLDGEGKGETYFQAPKGGVEDFEDGNLKYIVGSEKEILERFWELARHYDTFVTYNGRGFDVPYLMIRSAVHEMKPTRNLMSNRYLNLQRDGKHVDLADQFTFYGALWPRPKLHFVVEAFGIKTPKGGLDGKQVPQAFRDGRYEEIARYCMADVVATKELYEKWSKYLNM